MKERKLRDRHTGAVTLQVRTTRGESLEYSRAQWLLTDPSRVLLHFKYEPKGRGGLFYYDITGLPTLEEYLHMSISAVQYGSLLRSIGLLGDLCAAHELPMESIRFEPDRTYVHQDSLLFVCLPITPLPAAQFSVLSLLGLLSDTRHVSFSLAGDADAASALSDFTRRSAVFSSFEFDQFLDQRIETRSRVPGRGMGLPAATEQARGTDVFDPFAALPPRDAGPVGLPIPSQEEGNLPPATDGSACRQDSLNALPAFSQVTEPDANSGAVDDPLHVQQESGVDIDMTEGRRPGGEAGMVTDHRSATSDDQLLPGANKEWEGKGRGATDERGPRIDTPAEGAQVGEGRGTQLLSGALGSPERRGGVVPVNEPAVATFTIVRDRDGAPLCTFTHTATIGRSPRCDARITGNSNVSRMHAMVTGVGQGRFALVDLGSANGTLVGNTRLSKDESAQIGFGERFQVADEMLHIEV